MISFFQFQVRRALNNQKQKQRSKQVNHDASKGQRFFRFQIYHSCPIQFIRRRRSGGRNSGKMHKLIHHFLD